VTLREEKFAHQLERFPNAAVSLIPAPGLVELVEAGGANTPAAEQLLTPILAPYKGKLDALVLGCTHYPFAAGAIRRVLGETVALIDGGDGTARETKRRLSEAGLLEEGEGSILWENSSDDETMIELCKQLMEA
jgi:glutamate racemase